VGLGEELGKRIADWKLRLLDAVSEKGASLEALERGAVRNPLASEVLFADRRFATPTGKVNLIHEVDPAPSQPTAERPLLLMALATQKSQASQMPSRMQEGLATVRIHPSAANGLRAGEHVRVESESGAIDAVLEFDERQRSDVALMPKGGWLSRGRCANELLRARTTDAGEGAAYYDTPVRLLPCR
jgi:anaerobic selenocysteine-containing dehydrogenase